MIGEVFKVKEIDDHGQPWVRKSWPNEAQGTCQSHSDHETLSALILTDTPAPDPSILPLTAHRAAGAQSWARWRANKPGPL